MAGIKISETERMKKQRRINDTTPGLPWNHFF